MGRCGKFLGMVCISLTVAASGQERIFRVELSYRAPGNGPAPNFSPKGTQVPLTEIAPGVALPDGAIRPAKSGVIQIGSGRSVWIPILVTADAGHPKDLCRLYLDRNRNGNYSDDGPAVSAIPSLKEKTKAWWSSFNKVELAIPYGNNAGGSVTEPYMVNFWAVRDGEGAPGIIRYSVASWRGGTAIVNGIEALVAVMDSDNNAVFDAQDQWSVLAASAPDAAKQVLSYNEARPTNRLMFLPSGEKELVLEFRNLNPAGKFIEFALVDRPVTKAADRASDDTLASERSRPRTKTPFTWNHVNLDAALVQAKEAGKLVIVDFETTWCGPCKSMDEWIWTDAEVASILNARFIGVKLDGDIEKELVKKFSVAGYPTGIMLDAAGKEIRRFLGYRSSKEILDWIAPVGDAKK
jgi:thiol-disulfide isomerase/thioredoxin